MSYKIDLSFLSSNPNLEKEQGILLIDSISSLSVSNEPGRIYPFEESPSERKIFGMIENMMGLHFGWDRSYKIRDNILDDANTENYIDGRTSNKPFQPIISGHFKFELIETEIDDTFFDLKWSHKKRDSSQVLAGANTKDYKAENKPDNRDNVGYAKTTVRRERVQNALFKYKVFCDDVSKEKLKEVVENPKTVPYLGDSESLVEVSFLETK